MPQLHMHIEYKWLFRGICYINTGKHTFKSLLNVDSFLGARLEVRNVAFRDTKCHGALVRDLDFCQDNIQALGCTDSVRLAYHSLIFLHVDLVAQHDLLFSS